MKKEYFIVEFITAEKSRFRCKVQAKDIIEAINKACKENSLPMEKIGKIETIQYIVNSKN